jgi:hypothetical protein
MAADDSTGRAALPVQFAELEQFVEWMISDELGRHRKRIGSGMEDLRRFYDAMLPRMDEIMGVLKQYPVDSAPPPEVHNLYFLALSFMEVSLPIELRWAGPTNAGAFLSTRIEIPHRP